VRSASSPSPAPRRGGGGRGYTAGIIGVCSSTGDMLEVVRGFTRAKPHNGLRRFIPALRRVNGSASHAGLGKRLVAAWRRSSKSRRCAAPGTPSATASTSAPR
jgi:chitosanase